MALSANKGCSSIPPPTHTVCTCLPLPHQFAGTCSRPPTLAAQLYGIPLPCCPTAPGVFCPGTQANSALPPLSWFRPQTPFQSPRPATQCATESDVHLEGVLQCHVQFSMQCHAAVPCSHTPWEPCAATTAALWQCPILYITSTASVDSPRCPALGEHV
jgi:hypothetical protein